jgi:hypothetical protein
VFCGDAVSSHAISGFFSRAKRATVGVTQAVQKIGTLHRVTAARANVVLELDGRPAYGRSLRSFRHHCSTISSERWR